MPGSRTPQKAVRTTRSSAHARDTKGRTTRAILQEQILFEKLVSDTSRKFVHVPASRVDEEIEQTLQTFVESLDADRGVLYQFDLRKKELYGTHLWARTGPVREVPEGAEDRDGSVSVGP